MTVSTTTNKIVLTADGLTNTFSFPFAVRSGGQSDIQVFTTVAGVITQLTLNTQYTVSLNAPISPNPTGVGGSVNIPSTPAAGTLITILRTMAETQPTSLANQGTLYQPVLEAADDNLTMLVQQLQELLGRQITVAVSDSTPSALPPAAQRANLAMGFDASGNPIAFSTAPAGTISSAMAPFVASASIAAAKALLGYGTMANENIGAAGKGIVDDGAGNALVKHIISAVSAGQSPTSANHMTDYVSSGTLVHTLPKLTNVFNGYELWFFCVSGTATLSPNAADNFPGLGGGVAIVLTVGQCARLVGDGVSGWQIFTGRIPGIGSTQTRQILTSGSGATYTTPAGCRRLVIRELGGGGGGGGSGTASTSAGGNGGNTTFNGITANGGSGGISTNGTGGTNGGAGGTGGAGSADLRRNGNPGGYGLPPGVASLGGFGANSPLGGGSAGTFSTPTAVQANTGSGGGGGGSGGATFTGGGGGGSGEYVEIIINNPAASYTYTIGAAGTAGGAGTGGSAGAAGSTGVIIVDEYY